MTTGQATDARADLEKRLQEAQAKVAPASRAVADAKKALDSNRQAPIEQLVELSGALSTAQKALDSANGDVQKLERGIQGLEAQVQYEADMVTYNESIRPIHELVNPIQASLLQVVQKSRKLFEESGVTGIHIHVTNIDGETLVVHDVDGLKKPATPKRTRSSGGGGGTGFRARLRKTPKGDLSLRDCFKEFALEAGVTQERYDLVIADPTNQGISHRGKAVADKLGFPEVEQA